MALKDSEYEPPTLPFPMQKSKRSADIRHSFMIDFDGWTFLNHGAFGGALVDGFNRSEQWRRYLEEQPLRYFDRELLPHLAHSTRRLAVFIKAPSKRNVALLPNVTSGINAVLAGHARESGTASALCILWDTSYGSVKKMALHYYDGNVKEIPFQAQYLNRLATSAEYGNEPVFVEALQDFLASTHTLLAGKQICLVLDQTTSNTALTMPVEELASLMKQVHPDALVVVDGAHGMLAQDTNLTDFFAAGVDVYLSNGHKWLSAPRGVALMAVADDAASRLANSVLRFPAVISHGVDEPDLFSRFVWDGCRDYTAALSIPVVLDYWGDPDVVRMKCKSVLRQGIQLLAEYWHPAVAMDTSSWPGAVTLADIESSLLSPMALVSLPAKFGDVERTSTDAKKIQDYLFSQNIEVPIKCINGRLFVRISCHIYNNMSDFERLALAVQRMP